MTRPRIAVVSPFIDKRHGTERRVAECISRLADKYEFHIYSQRIEDMDLNRVVWHRIPVLKAPHLFGCLWWFGANHFWRWWDRHVRRLAPDAVYSPGINCLDADAVSVHIVFARFRRSVAEQLRLARNPVRAWPRILHRRLYYRLIEALERHVYRQPDCSLAVVSHKIAADLGRYYGRTAGITVVYNGLDFERFSPAKRCGHRDEARSSLGLRPQDFGLLLIGNDWKNKGLLCLLEAIVQTDDPRLHVLMAGTDNSLPFTALIHRAGLGDRVHFLTPRPDVEFFYAAADAYVSPTFEDAFAQPPAEAMACGLPVITSSRNGGAEIITDGEDGFVLQDPTDSATLAAMVTRLVRDPGLRQRMGEAAAQTALKYTWERNAELMRELFEQARRQKA